MTWLSTTTPKCHRGGTVRSRAPAETWEAVQPHLAAAGITRVANVTGLDHIGIPTFAAVRPNARSLSASHGKGVTAIDARVSAVMEALELQHAEHFDGPLRLATVFDMQRADATVDLNALPRAFRAPYPALRTLWTAGHDLMSDRPRQVPLGLVTMDMTLPLLPGSDVYPPSSNGLASGNTRSEALLHALCELVERDAHARFFDSDPTAQQARRLDLSSVTAPHCRALLQRLSAADMLIEVWDMTGALQLPTYLCALLDAEDDPQRRVGLAYGSGTHLDPAVALSRALTEAAQARLTRISGSRDDIQPEVLAALQDPTARARHLQHFAATAGPCAMRGQAVYVGDTFEDDLRFVLQRLAESGAREAVAVDLSRPDWPIAVVRAIVPGLRAPIEAPAYGSPRREDGP